MTDKDLALPPPTTAVAEAAQRYLAPAAPKALTKPPLPLDKRMSVRRRVKVGIDLDSLLPSMAEEAKLLARHGDDVEALEVSRGFCILVNDASLMDVNVLFRFVRGTYGKPEKLAAPGNVLTHGGATAALPLLRDGKP